MFSQFFILVFGLGLAVVAAWKGRLMVFAVAAVLLLLTGINLRVWLQESHSRKRPGESDP
ncbi:hypothetical protein SAMN04488540_103182 [Ferrimonas sediminum]|uniref:Uncharacterized protein n=1 Tax=Ferrimonas sediminum TaxID=718193 RepID=A0A1G8NNP0_9GAMM|nr:hypothetical protein [Ferrimonas sediminum]SDI81808.1 hypothetical protein SAMN04488540_103182 [Ferrimonas sediminum]